MALDVEIRNLLTPPARRSVKEMSLQIGELENNSVVGVTFRSSVFGVYCIWGATRRAVHGDYILGATSIETKGKPVSNVLRLDMSGRVSTATGPVDEAIRLEHGSIVRASFERGDEHVTVLGPAVVTTGSGMVGVGRWILAFQDRPGRYLVALDIVSSAEDTGLTVPERMVSWSDADDIPES